MAEQGRTISFQLSTGGVDKLSNVSETEVGHFVQQLNPVVHKHGLAKANLHSRRRRGVDPRAAAIHLAYVERKHDSSEEPHTCCK